MVRVVEKGGSFRYVTDGGYMYVCIYIYIVLVICHRYMPACTTFGKQNRMLRKYKYTPFVRFRRYQYIQGVCDTQVARIGRCMSCQRVHDIKSSHV